MRNHIKRAAKKLGGQNLWRIRAKKDWLRVMCQQEKEQMLELPPLMTNKQILTHTHTYTQSRPPKTATFPVSLSHEAGQKERDILWLWMMARRWSGKERRSTSWCLFVSVMAELLFVFECGTCLGASVFGECPVFRHLYLSASQYTIQPGALMG